MSRARGPLELKRASAHDSEAALTDAQERASAFERAFAGNKDGHTAIYGTNMPFGGPGIITDFQSLKGHLAFPVAGRAEIVRAKRRGGGGLGLEMRVPAGSPVQAVYGGRVAFAEKYANFGRTVIVDHGNNYFTVSAGLDSVRVRVGEDVTAGSTLGNVSDTGLYFEIRRSGDTIDPAPWFGI